MTIRFRDHYYNEAIINHKESNKTREVIHAPKIVSMPEELIGKRLITIANNDDIYFTFVFDKDSNDPISVIQGSWENPYGKTESNPMMAKMLLMKHYTPQDEKGQVHPMRYGGEVRIHPPFEGYKEYPEDTKAVFFTDFDNVYDEYVAGKTIDDPLVKLN